MTFNWSLRGDLVRRYCSVGLLLNNLQLEFMRKYTLK